MSVYHPGFTISQAPPSTSTIRAPPFMCPCQLLYSQHIHISKVKKDIPDSGTEIVGDTKLASFTLPENEPSAPMAYRYGNDAASSGP